MVLALPASPAVILFSGAPTGSGVMVRLTDREPSGRLARLATPGALVYSSIFSLVQLGLVVEYPGRTHHAGWAFLATVCYLPLHLHHVSWAVRGARPPAGVPTLAALAAVVAAALPLTGSNWLPVFAVVAVSAVIVLPWPWSVLAAAAVVIAQAPLAHATGSPVPGAGSYYVLTVCWRASALFVPIWLLGAVRRLQAARQALASEAVVRERLRADTELRATVGSALDEIVTRGERVTAILTDGDPRQPVNEVGGSADRLLDEVVDGSRRALAQARQLSRRYGRPSLAAEAQTAATLLTVAGIPTRVELPSEGLPATAFPAVGTRLRTATARVLQDDGVRSCVIRLTHRDGQVQVELDVQDVSGAVRGVQAS